MSHDVEQSITCHAAGASGPRCASERIHGQAMIWLLLAFWPRFFRVIWRVIPHAQAARIPAIDEWYLVI